MENIVLYIVGMFFAIGVIDYMLGNKFKLGSIFESGINNMGSLAISMVGILSITPLISEFIIKNLSQFADIIGIDITIISSSIIAIDMGAFNLAKDLTQTIEMKYFSGVLIASILGCTISFTLPLALGIIEKEDVKILSKGILCGIITLPIGLFFGGVLLKMPIKTIIINLLPIIMLAILVSIGIYFKTEVTIKIFTYLGKGIVMIGLIGFLVQGFISITGVDLIAGLMPIEEALTTVGKIAIFLGGAYVMIEVAKVLLYKHLEKLRLKVWLSPSSITALIGSLASAIIVFTTFKELDYKGKVVCSAFSVGGAYVLGGQLGYVATEAKEVVLIYMFTKLLCGTLAIGLALILLKKEEINEVKEDHIIN
ncbi:MAG: ethanolamine utilization protein EutH [Clostridium sp.]